jgi:hypothetical protein
MPTHGALIATTACTSNAASAATAASVTARPRGSVAITRVGMRDPMQVFAFA